VFPDAQILLQGVLQRAPDHRLARMEHASVLNELHRFREAQRELELLLKEQPQDWVLRMLHASAVVGLGEHERAVSLYQGLLAGGPQDCIIHLLIGHGLKTLGRSSEAVQAYRRAASCREDFGDAYWSLADLKTYRFTDAEVTSMRHALEAPATAPADRYHLCFALAKALEDRGEFAESFRLYEQGNGLKLSECRYLPEPMEINTREQIKVCTSEFFASRRGWGSPQPGPIFIVGLPRSGSTLLEQILASHSQVEGTFELPTIQHIVNRLRGFAPEPNPENPNYPRMLADLRAGDFARLGEQYLADTRVYRSGKTYFIDKMPNNFRHVGLLHLMLPNARIIDARREPMACCFSNFKQFFASGQEFTYSIEHIARYYRTYLQLMRHWDAVLPGRVLRVQYEAVVEDLEGSVRRILEFCGLEFEPRCLAFHENKRSVRTASAEQVRRGISREGLEQWKNFEPWLGPLREQLGEAVTGFRE
jgi:tetratricopeptide (TPR) repeat protein